MRVEECGMEGVRLLVLKAHPDSRGSFLELFRREWLPDIFGGSLQVNCSRSFSGTIRGMHYHRNQWDLWLPVQGCMNAGLADLRQDSPTYRKTFTIRLDSSDPRGLLIPPGVAHGFAALTDLTMVYVVSNYSDGNDEMGIAYDDPGLQIDWGVENPVLSPRDRENPNVEW